MIPRQISQRKPFLWINPKLQLDVSLDRSDMQQARADWQAFEPLLKRVFGVGIIDSELKRLNSLLDDFSARAHLLKMDSSLPVAGSIKARGGFFEVLSHARELAYQAGIITQDDDLSTLADKSDFFNNYSLHVASTGNLGMSIGLMGRALGFRVYVHMSADAKEWKKDLLRSRGAEVIEYKGDYSLAVREGRHASEQDPGAYFVDDERSLRLFWGYSKAAYDLLEQLPEEISPEKPLFVTIPCGVGGAPGGIAYGLKALLGESVHLFFAEPLESPAVLLGMASGQGENIKVQDVGLSGSTLADGLAVGKPSEFVCRQMEPVLSGIFTITDEALQAMQYQLQEIEAIKCEPSACAGLFLPHFLQSPTGQDYLAEYGLKEEDITYVYWATGGDRVPEELYLEQLSEGRQVLLERPDVFLVDTGRGEATLG